MVPLVGRPDHRMVRCLVVPFGAVVLLAGDHWVLVTDSSPLVCVVVSSRVRIFSFSFVCHLFSRSYFVQNLLRGCVRRLSYVGVVFQPGWCCAASVDVVGTGCSIFRVLGSARHQGRWWYSSSFIKSGAVESRYSISESTCDGGGRSGTPLAS